MLGFPDSMKGKPEAVGVVLLGALLASCASAPQGTPAAQAPQRVAPTPPPDPTADLIARADEALKAGQEQAKDGHLNRAREEFDRAADTYLTAPGGAFSNPRLAEAYRRTMEAIHLWEIESLAAGDGFAEPRPEPASVDEVTAINVDDAPASESERRVAAEAVQEEKNDFPVELNDPVLSCINLYQGRLRDWFTAALTRGGRYLPRIREIFAEEGVPQDLAYLAMVESAFHTSALSRAKAKGMWQFISDTGRRYGLSQDWWVDERSDPEKATRAAAKYLKDLYGMFNDWNLAMAGYNAGEFNVQRGLERYKVADFWSLSKTRALRRETKNYVPLIHAAIVVAKAPERYGFSVEPEALPAAEALGVEGAVDLRFISECAGTTLDRIQLLNPSLRRLATPANRRFDLRVPMGSATTVATCLATTPPDRRVRFRTHVVARGQTLSSIAATYSIRTADLASANSMPLGRRLSVGMELIIPIDPRVSVAAAHAPAAAPSRGPELPAPTGSVKISYRVKAGDTLGAIATQFGTSIQALQSWNGIRGSRIVAGDTLTVYATRGF